jgi:hypothetical protein
LSLAPGAEVVPHRAPKPIRCGTNSEMAFVLELWAFLRARKKFWLLPIIVVLLIFGGLLILAQGSAVAPFVYTIF